MEHVTLFVNPRNEASSEGDMAEIAGGGRAWHSVYHGRKGGCLPPVEAARWLQIQEVFHAASELPPDARSSYLDEVCAGDTELRNEVEGVLRSYRDRKSTRLNSSHLGNSHAVLC